MTSSARQRSLLLCEAAAAADLAAMSDLLAAGVSPDPVWDRAAHDEAAAALQRVLADVGSGLSDDDAELVRESLRDSLPGHDDPPLASDIPLHRAAASGSAQAVQVLLDAGADVQQRDSRGRTALWDVGSAAVVDTLLAAGLSTADRDEFEWTPLAANVDDLDRVRWLIRAGADVNASFDRGYTVLMTAVGSYARSRAVAEALVAAGADPHAGSELGYNVWHAAIDVSGEANEEQSVREICTYLRELRVDLEHRNRDGATPLERAIVVGTAVEVRVLCELGADVNAGTGGVDGDPMIFLAVTTSVEQDGKLAALLAAGADATVVDRQGRTPLQVATAELSAMADPAWDDSPQYREVRRTQLERCVARLSGGSGPH